MPERTSYPYPPPPSNVDVSVLQPGKEFRAGVFDVLKSIVAFIATYVFLVCASLALAAACAVAAYWLVVSVSHFLVLVFGVGLVCFGILIIYFISKFVFNTTSVDRSRMTEITAKDQPILFDFISRVAKETHAPLPKHIYLSPDSNASVFYDSNFFSLFLPVRKNLNVGLALVNTVNVTEFKAILAHEFGHFSQKSMKLGVYVYHVKHIIHDMLFNNREYDETVEGFGKVSGVFMFFAELTKVVVGSIQEILTDIYERINESGSSLSRQMEFHADAVAASVSGSAPLIDALYRLELSEFAYQQLLTLYNGWIPENRKAMNAYQHHSYLMKHLAKTFSIDIVNNQVKVSIETQKKFSVRRVAVKDQWASHPSTADREKALCKLNFQSVPIHDSAWSLFSNAPQLQSMMTDELYDGVKFNGSPMVLDDNGFQVLFEEMVGRYCHHKDYKGFYDRRSITVFDPEKVISRRTSTNKLEDILTEKTVGLQSCIDGLIADIRLLQFVGGKSSNVKTFDFDGIKRSTDEAKDLIKLLTVELKEAESALRNADEEIFLLYYQRSAERGNAEVAAHGYMNMFNVTKTADQEVKHATSMISEASQLLQRRVSEGMALAVSNNMNRKGGEAKRRISDLLSDKQISLFCNDDQRSLLEAFVNDNRKYFFNVGLDREAISLFVMALRTYAEVLLDYSFAQKEHVLNDQLMAISPKTNLVTG
jgi:Zn-dependent protease with chaperone function